MYQGEDIIRAFDAVPEDSPLPRVGPLSVFYERFIDREKSLLLESGGTFRVFYFNSHDTIESITGGQPGFFFENKGDIVLCLIIFNPGGDQITSYLPFDRRDAVHIAFLRTLKNERVLNLHFITLLYGELYRIKSLALEVPAKAMDDMLL